MKKIEPYQPWNFCESVGCENIGLKDQVCKHYCKAYKFHQYLRDHNLILEEGSPLVSVWEAATNACDELEGHGLYAIATLQNALELLTR